MAPRGALWPALRANAMADDALLEVEVSGYTLHGDDPKTVRSRPLDAPVSIDQPAIAVSRTQLTLRVCVGPATRIARPLVLCGAAIPHIHGAPPSTPPARATAVCAKPLTAIAAAQITVSRGLEGITEIQKRFSEVRRRRSPAVAPGRASADPRRAPLPSV